MLRIPYNSALGWSKPEIIPYQNISLDPFAPVFHYGLGCFEGMKAYRSESGKISMFRPKLNMKRLSSSAQRLGFPDFPQDELLNLMKHLISIDQDWVPSGKGYSLYLRPTMIGTSPTLGVKMSKDVLLYVVLSPVGPYFAQGFKPVKLFADTVHTRAHLGGTGAFKLGCNYACTIAPQQASALKGYDQILWLRDGYITEVGQMNLFCLWKTKTGKTQLITAPLDGTILPGIVRLSVLELVKSLIKDIEVVEDYYTIGQLAEAVDEGRVLEIFGTGTGAIVCPVAGFEWNSKYYEIPKNYDFSQRIAKSLEDIQYGVVHSDWMEDISRR
jgi:branched-chain amino acid aminotransferase